MKTERLNLRISSELKEKVETIAAGENRSVTNWIETLIKRELEKAPLDKKE